MDTKVRTKDVQVSDEPSCSFEDLQLNPQLLEGLKSAGFFKPSPVQLKAIPLGKIGLDLIIQAKSGTGKTCVFAVIALEQILACKSKALQVLILAPTREVALQICSVIKSVSGHMNIKTQAFIGGQSVKEDKMKLKSCQIAVGTPGRILHLMTENLLPTTNIRMLILDEADKLLAPEFQENINLVYSKLPDNKQILSLSATYPSYMATYVTRYMRTATFVRLNKVDPSLRGIKQYFKLTQNSSLNTNASFDTKVEELLKLLSTIQFQQSIVFINYQLKAESLCKRLTSKGWPAIFISGHIDQSERNLAISQLKQFKCRILVSTDLTARGIDAENVDLIVCMDLASDPETYLHRIGRAGRYGCQGTAVSFICERDEASLFETIIDSYNLRITQFGESLTDVVSIRNDSDDVARIDDVTIEKVNLSKEELDMSLFEYEQLKNTKPNLTSKLYGSATTNKENKHSKLELTNSVTLNELIQVSDLYRNIENNCEETSLKDTDIEKVQREFCGLANENCLVVDRNYVIEMRLRLKAEQKERLEAKYLVDTKETVVEFGELYKWTSVVKEQKQTKKRVAIKKSASDEGFIYAYYYNYYYQHFLDQLIKV